LVAHFKLLELRDDIIFELVDGFGDRGQHIAKLVAEAIDFGVDNIVVHFPSALLVDQVVVDVCFLGESLHEEAHLLLE